MLVIHGEKDYRVPVTQGLACYNILKGKGVPARLVYFPDENHWVLKPRNARLWYGEVLGCPLLASGTRIGAEDLDPDWDEATLELPASEVLENVQVLTGVSALRFMQAMGATPIALGVKCGHCHDLEDYALDALAAKQTARRMLVMAHAIDTDYFDATTAVTCWTCHRGESDPRFSPPQAELSARVAAFPAAAEPPEDLEWDLAQDAYKDIRVFEDLPAHELKTVMAEFSASLGVGCDHCHVAGGFELDGKPAKERAREMVRMTRAIGEDHFEGAVELTCWNCHRGEIVPARAPGHSP